MPTGTPRIAYSCVVDDTPFFRWQCLIYINSLLYNSKIKPQDIFIHLIGDNLEIRDYIHSNNINLISVKPFGDGKYCNKLSQFYHKTFNGYDYIFLCDADIAFAENINHLVKENREKVIAKTVDADNPRIDTLKHIFHAYGMENSEVVSTYSGDTFASNCNGGLIGIPYNYFDMLGQEWRRFAEELLEDVAIKKRLGPYVKHIDQIAFCLALTRLKIPFSRIGTRFNTPTHNTGFLPAISLELNGSPPAVIHYHAEIDHLGCIKLTGVPLIDQSVTKINDTIRSQYTNRLFWDFRYHNYPEVGSGIGSRGSVLAKKKALLRIIGIERMKSVLDVGCGDCEVISLFQIGNYTGVDISDESLRICRDKIPHGSFIKYDTNGIINEAELVLCLDVLLHQTTYESYRATVEFVSKKTKKRLVVSGYMSASHLDKSHMCFFYENIVESIKNTGLFKHIFIIAKYRGLAIVVADKQYDIFRTEKNCNSIRHADLESHLRESRHRDELLQCVAASELAFGWFTKHRPRVFEYPWVLSQLDYELDGQLIADFGAGITPLPLLISMRGAKVFTVDHGRRIPQKDLGTGNEWGFFDYAEIDGNITSINSKFDTSLFGDSPLDAWISVSVIEHLPATERRRVFSGMRLTLRTGGRIILTLDLQKNTFRLWNRCAGITVEPSDAHGDVRAVIGELEACGFGEVWCQRVPMPENEPVDIAFIAAVAVKAPQREAVSSRMDILRALPLALKTVLTPTRQAKYIEESRLFDEEWYVSQHADVDFSKTSPACHYLTTGWKEGRDPSELFCGRLYLASRPHLSRLGICPLSHHLARCGAQIDAIIPERVADLLKPINFAGLYDLGNKKTSGTPYRVFYERRGIQYTSIDMNGLDGALALDLSRPVNLPPREAVANIGTSEHIMDQEAVFKNIHSLAAHRMIHWVPAAGCHPEHGYWGYGLNFFIHLAEINAYRIDKLYIERTYKNWTLICCSLSKTVDTRQDFSWAGDSMLTFNENGSGGVSYY